MKAYCTISPSKGKELFTKLRNSFGYKDARKIFLTGINPNFKHDYRESLSLDAEGIPSFSSLMKINYIKNLIGNEKIIKAINKKFKIRTNTINNYNLAIDEAHAFNTNSEQKDEYVAIVDYTENGNIMIKAVPRNKSNIDIVNNQYGAAKVNEKLINIFEPLGLTIGILSDAEVKAGRVGVTNFSAASNIAKGFSSIIRVANNMEGAQALTEEFAHTIIGIFRDEPLIERSISSLARSEESLMKVLGESYKDVVEFYDGNMNLVAEEALGHILQKNLINNNIVEEVHNPSLFKRLINFIISKFKKYSTTDVNTLISSIDSNMGMLAEEVLSGQKEITKEDINQSYRDVEFNALSDRIERNINILKNAAKTEVKRHKISKNTDFTKDYDNIMNITNSTSKDADTVLGIINYAQQALSELKNLNYSFHSYSSMTLANKFGFLRSVRSYIQSYDPFISALNEALIEEELEEDDMFMINYGTEEEPLYLKDVLKDLNNATKILNKKYMKNAIDSFTIFLKPFFKTDLVIPFGKDKGKTITLEELIKEADNDISFLDRWLDSMANSSDLLLQLFDSVIKEANDAIRIKTIKDVEKIQALMRRAENLGITSYDWMFEVDDEGNKTGNYISEVNIGQFNKDMERFNQYLDDKYGKNPKGEDAINKMNEKDEWYEEHSSTDYGSVYPSSVYYTNSKYKSLSASQKEILDAFLELKREFDNQLPETRVYLNKAIQMRKTTSNRIIESISSPSKLFNNIKNSFSESLLDGVADDDQIFGEDNVKKGLTDFAGNEYLTVPVLYTTRLKDPNDLSTDVFSTLMMYAMASNTYKKMDEIVDPLEVGRTIVSDSRKVRETRGGNPLVEKFKSVGAEVTNKIFKSTGSNIEQKLQDALESKVYHKYLKDEGTFEVFGKKVNKSKLTSWALKWSSLAQLGLNWLADSANIANGICMQNIEAAVNEYFSVKDLAKADLEYTKAMKDFGMELGSTIKTSKLALFDTLFNIDQDYGSKLGKNKKKNLLQKIFGVNIAFLGQDAGNHWLYNRTAIAMALKERVLLNGVEMSLWEALKVENSSAGEGIKRLNADNIQNLDHTPFNIAKFSRKVAHVNQFLFGIYNEEDANAANRICAGRLVMQYRKWMKPMFNRRFQKGQYDLTTGKYEEGYYRTTLRIANELIRGKFQIAAVWGSLTDAEKKNLYRAVVEMIQLAAVWALANLIDWPDDDKDKGKTVPLGIKYAEYLAKRMEHELGGLTPSFIFVQENMKTLTTPLPILSAVNDLKNLTLSTLTPSDWNDELQSGPYKGMSTLEKHLIKAPLPVVSQYYQVDKFLHNIDNSIQYYMRSY